MAEARGAAEAAPRGHDAIPSRHRPCGGVCAHSGSLKSLPSPSAGSSIGTSHNFESSELCSRRHTRSESPPPLDPEDKTLCAPVPSRGRPIRALVITMGGDRQRRMLEMLQPEGAPLLSLSSVCVFPVPRSPHVPTASDGAGCTDFEVGFSEGVASRTLRTREGVLRALVDCGLMDAAAAEESRGTEAREAQQHADPQARPTPRTTASAMPHRHASLCGTGSPAATRRRMARHSASGEGASSS
ncbi:hypothetical protein AB1Y20_015942 [Prymnesium parvum]|uniref:Uncharacterized protein n=1 Tax=Prymnesium parvum TaxID=97485 RepID=A0AB34K2D8_PRYPA